MITDEHKLCDISDIKYGINILKTHHLQLIKKGICTFRLFMSNKYSGRRLFLYMTFVPMIMTSKHFWLLQCIYHQTRVTYP